MHLLESAGDRDAALPIELPGNDDGWRDGRRLLWRPDIAALRHQSSSPPSGHVHASPWLHQTFITGRAPPAAELLQLQASKMSAVHIFPGRLVELAPELLELVLSFLTPRDLVSFGRTCRRAAAFIRPDNQILWRRSFLQVFDDPTHAWELLQPTARAGNRDREAHWDWFQEVQRRLTAFNAICHNGNAALLSDPESIITTLLDVLETASYSESTGVNTRISFNLEFLDRIFRSAPNPERIVHDYHRDIESVSLPVEPLNNCNRPITRSMLGRKATVPQWASRFHIFHGMTKREENSVLAKAAARSLIYDWRTTGPNADYGPFLNDKSGIVNWQVLEAATSLMLRIFEGTRGSYLRTPAGFRDSIPCLLPLNPSCKEDWAGVTRIWLGTYAFLDYRALVHYNFANNLEYPMDLGAYEEACGDIMRLKLKINDSDELKYDHRLQTDLPICEDLPVLYFTGSSSGRSTGRPPILVRGSTSLIPGGRQVRWRFIFSYAGADQWQLEGVQPGGIRSGGIFGIWSHCDHDDHSPVGPFCYFPFELCDPSQKSHELVHTDYISLSGM
ncbi:hypothetical protein K469DRAFT_255430 [Zopfia rhizophila CBS 207.26]|uniref:F-box domain-containing protein n=1 Tax=Zopfia rhizophila CBS 207.26 TaxID=1314779 RepID=A0A6A6DS42_9PEZI|nr:hypothetical protein K469DRAFT_255430 [Zopfia rhizophila CBS 207.26]